MSQWLQRTNKIHLRCFWGSIYDQCDPSPLMVVSQFWSSGISWWQLWPFVDHKVGRKQVTTKWATSLQTLNGGSDNLDMETYFLFPFQMEDTIFLLNCELVADTCTQNSHSGCRHSQLLIPLQVSSFSVLTLTLTTCNQNSHSVSTPRQQATVGSYREFLMRGRRLSRALPASLVLVQPELENQLYVASPP